TALLNGLSARGHHQQNQALVRGDWLCWRSNDSVGSVLVQWLAKAPAGPGGIGDRLKQTTSSRTATVTITPKGAYGGWGARTVTFMVKVDGREIPAKKRSFGPVVLDLPPGSHQIETWCKDTFMNY